MISTEIRGDGHAYEINKANEELDLEQKNQKRQRLHLFLELLGVDKQVRDARIEAVLTDDEIQLDLQKYRAWQTQRDNLHRDGKYTELDRIMSTPALEAGRHLTNATRHIIGILISGTREGTSVENWDSIFSESLYSALDHAETMVYGIFFSRNHVYTTVWDYDEPEQVLVSDWIRLTVEELKFQMGYATRTSS